MKKLLVLLMAMMISVIGFGALKTWNGPIAGGDWQNAAFWSPAGVPIGGDDVLINPGLGNSGNPYKITNVPWYSTEEPTAPYSGGTAYTDLNSLRIMNTSYIKLLGQNFDPGNGAIHNVEIRILPLTTTTGVPPNFLVDAGCALNCLGDANGIDYRVAICLGFCGKGVMGVGSNFLVCTEWATQIPGYGGTYPKYHSFRIQSSINPATNPPFGACNMSFMENCNVQVRCLAEIDFSMDKWHLVSQPTQEAVTCCTFKTDYIAQFSEPLYAWTGLFGTNPWPLQLGSGYEVYDISTVPHPVPYLCDCPPYIGQSITSYHVYVGFLNGFQADGDLPNWPIEYHAGTNNPGWNLVGNIYPIAVDLPKTSLPATPANWTWGPGLDPSIWIWNAAGNKYDWYNWNTGLKDGPPVGAGTAFTNVIIPAMQGFFVHVGSSTLPYNMQILRGARDVTAQTLLYKEGEVLANILNIAVDGYGKHDAAVVYFYDGATPQYDRNLDVLKLNNGPESPSLYLKSSDGKDLCCKLYGFGNASAPMSFIAAQSGDYTLTASQISSFSDKTGIVLKDLATNTTQDLRVNPVYSFSANVGDDPNRFIIFFSDVSNGVNTLTSSNAFKVYSFGNNIFVQNNDPQASGTVFVYDMLGRKVKEQKLNNDPVTQINLNVTRGLYIVSVVTNKGSYNQKVYIN